jgi:drug/metabolite transporter (DMT)-like permease
MLKYTGEIFAILTALLWTATALIFEKTGKLIGPNIINFLRLLIAFVFLSVYTFITRSYFFPVDANSETWFWLILSGIIGFTFGDYFLFKALTTIGARISMLIMAFSPAIAAITGWIFINDKLTLIQIIGIIVTLFGIVLVVLQKKNGNKSLNAEQKQNRKFLLKGILFAFLGAVGQGTQLVISKKGMGTYNAFAATQIRIIAGIIGFAIIITLTKEWKNTILAVKNKKALILTSVAAFIGSFLGISFSLLAIKNTNTGVASTLMAIQPVLIIVPAAILFKEKIKFIEVVGAIIAVGGIILLFI